MISAGVVQIGSRPLDVVFLEDKTCPHPVLRTTKSLQMMLVPALVNCDVVGASPEERRILARYGHPFGRVR
jgi:hypothetical protein